MLLTGLLCFALMLMCLAVAWKLEEWAFWGLLAFGFALPSGFFLCGPILFYYF